MDKENNTIEKNDCQCIKTKISGPPEKINTEIINMETINFNGIGPDKINLENIHLENINTESVNLQKTDNKNEVHNEYIINVYKNPKIEICDENNYKSIRAIDDIKIGELLLIEHVFAGSMANCHILVEHNEYLFNMYHPRSINFTDIENKFTSVQEKISHNCFGLENNDKLITDTITKINHHCDPNCVVYIQEKYEIKNTHTIFMELFAIRNIKKGTELTISYGPVTGHERDFVCNCGKELPERKKIFSIISSLAKELSIRNNNIIRELICNYLETNASKKILMNHFLATKGIFMNKNSISAFSSEGEKLINNMIYRYMNIKESDLESIDDNIKKKPMNNFKINIFLAILNSSLFKNNETNNNDNNDNNSNNNDNNINSNTNGN